MLNRTNARGRPVDRRTMLKYLGGTSVVALVPAIPDEAVAIEPATITAAITVTTALMGLLSDGDSGLGDAIQAMDLRLQQVLRNQEQLAAAVDALAVGLDRMENRLTERLMSTEARRVLTETRALLTVVGDMHHVTQERLKDGRVEAIAPHLREAAREKLLFLLAKTDALFEAGWAPAIAVSAYAVCAQALGLLFLQARLAGREIVDPELFTLAAGRGRDTLARASQGSLPSLITKAGNYADRALTETHGTFYGPAVQRLLANAPADGTVARNVSHRVCSPARKEKYKNGTKTVYDTMPGATGYMIGDVPRYIARTVSTYGRRDVWTRHDVGVIAEVERLSPTDRVVITSLQLNDKSGWNSRTRRSTDNGASYSSCSVSPAHGNGNIAGLRHTQRALHTHRYAAQQEAALSISRELALIERDRFDALANLFKQEA